MRALAFVHAKPPSSAPGSSGNPIEAADVEKFRQHIYDKGNSSNFGIDKTVPIQTSSSQLGQNIYTDLAYPFINEWQCEWTDISNGSFGVQGNGGNQTTQQLGAESVPIQTWSSQLGQQIYTNLATPFINEWRADEMANGSGGAAIEYSNAPGDGIEPCWSAIEVDWESFVFTVPTQTPLPMLRPRACGNELQDTILKYIDTYDSALLGGEKEKQDACSEASECSDKSVAPDGRFRYRSEADEAEFEVDYGESEEEGRRRRTLPHQAPATVAKAMAT